MSVVRGEGGMERQSGYAPAPAPSQESYLLYPTGEYKNPLHLPPSSSIPHQHRSRKAHTSQFTSPPFAPFHSIFPLHLKPTKETYRTFFHPNSKKTECSSQPTSSQPSPSSLPHWQTPLTWSSAIRKSAVDRYMIQQK